MGNSPTRGLSFLKNVKATMIGVVGTSYWASGRGSEAKVDYSEWQRKPTKSV